MIKIFNIASDIIKQLQISNQLNNVISQLIFFFIILFGSTPSCLNFFVLYVPSSSVHILLDVALLLHLKFQLLEFDNI